MVTLIPPMRWPARLSQLKRIPRTRPISMRSPVQGLEAVVIATAIDRLPEPSPKTLERPVMLAPIFTQRIGPRSAASDPGCIPFLATDPTVTDRPVHDTVADGWVRHGSDDALTALTYAQGPQRNPR
jgi:hypothetical protein